MRPKFCPYVLEVDWLKELLLPPFIKEYNYRTCAGQTSLNLIKFIVTVLALMSLNKFIIKIYYIANLMIFFVSWMLLLFYITLVKVQIDWLIKSENYILSWTREYIFGTMTSDIFVLCCLVYLSILLNWKQMKPFFTKIRHTVTLMEVTLVGPKVWQKRV